MSRQDTVKTRTSLLDSTPRPVTTMSLGPQKRARLRKKSVDQISQHSDNFLVPTTPNRTRFENIERHSSLNHHKLHKRISAGQLV